MNPLMMDPVHAHTGPTTHGSAVYPHAMAVSNHGSPIDPIHYPQQQQHFGIQGGFAMPPIHMQQQQQYNYREQDFERSCVVYVSGLNSGIDDSTFFEAFRKFGNILSCVRRTVDFEMKPSGQQYAFIRYSSPQEAVSAIQQGEIDVQGRKLNIRPRDKKGTRSQRQSSHGSPESRPQSYGARGGEQILRLINKNHSGSNHQNRNHHYQDRMSYDRNNMDGLQNDYHQTHPLKARPTLLSKALNVANLPPDMGPKHLYALFEEIGPVEGCYIFPVADTAGRRYGHVVMNSFYFAQKAVESLHGRVLGEHVLDVSYKTSDGTDAPPSSSEPPSPPHVVAAPPQMQQMFGPHPSFHQHQSVQHNQAFHNPSHPMGWVQNGMGNNFPPRHFGGMQQPPYGVPAPHLMPFFGGNQVSMFGQPHVDDNPPFDYPTSPPMHGMRWEQSPEQKHFSGNRNDRRYDAPQGLHANNYSRQQHQPEYADSSNSELQPRSVSNSTIDSTGTAATSVFPAEESFKQECENSPPENKDGKEAVVSSSTYTGVGLNSFETLTPPIIPETKKPTDPCNLFIKNLDDCVISTSEELKNLFESFGQVASAHLATYPESKISRGYGFVAFAKAEDAAKAKDKINNILVGKKRVFVSYAERKEDRAKRLKSIFQGKNPDEEEDDEVKKETDEAGEADEAVATTDEEGNNGKNMMKEEPIDASIVIEVSTTADVEESLKAKEEEELPVASKKVATESGSKRGGVSRNKAQVGGQKGTTTKGFKSTPLDKITEVEEEKVVPTEKSVGDSDATSGVVPEVAVTPSLDALAKVPAPLGRTNKADAEGTGSKASTGGGNNKRSTRRSAGTQKITSSQVQTAVPSLKQISSLGRSSSRIPVQNMGGPLQNIPPTGPRLNNDVTTQNQGNPTATTIAAAAGGPNHYPKRRGGYKGNNPRNGRSLVDKSGADGATGQKEGEQKGTGGVKKTVTGQVGTAPVAAH